MYRFIIIILALLFVTMPVQADVKRVIETVASEDSSTAVDVPTTLTRYSKSFSLINSNEADLGVMYKATSDGTVTATIQAQTSYQRPTTELAADAAYVMWETPESVSDEAWHAMTLDTVIMPYARFKVTGSGSNDATTEIQFKVMK